MDEKFEDAIEVTLEFEGGYVKDPDDPGGATNMGVCLRMLEKLGEIDPEDGYLLGDMDHDGDIDVDDIRRMSRDEAIKIYRSQYWERYRYELIDDPGVAAKVFDLAVNMGPGRAHKLLQRAVNLISGVGLMVDGAIGARTISAVNACYEDDLLDMLRDLAASFYSDLAMRRPPMRKYLAGWLRRARA